VAEKKQTNKKSGTLNRYFYSKTWFKTKHSLISQDEVEHRLQNNLPLDDLFDARDSKYKKAKPNTERKSGSGRPKNNEDEGM
jgi:hypothetical protein